MHAWVRWTLVCVILALSASVAPPARASFGDCTSRAYRGTFDPRFADARYGDFDCVERLRLPVSTGGGERQLRIIHEFNADWIADEAAMREFDRGARAAIEAFARLGGSLRLEDVTIYLADDFPPPEGADRFSDIAALTDFADDGECRIVVYLVGPATRSAFAASVITHEFFHCVEAANLAPEQLNTGATSPGGSGGDWWIEGAATWFTALAIPDAALVRGTAHEFDAASPTTALNHMSYAALVFFLWLGEDASPQGVMTFLSGMATSRGDAAQRAAMMSQLPQEGWLRFAEDYLDRDIHHPHGTELRLEPAQGDIWQWSATRTQALPLEPFVLARGVVAFECGHWRTSVRPGAMHGARPEDGGDWAGLPEEIDTSSGSGGNHRFAAINATAARVEMRIVGTMESGCGDCAGSHELDACVVGNWQLTGGGAAEWMRRQGVPGNFSTGGESVSFRADGSYVTGAMHGAMDVDGRDGSHAEGTMSAQAGGRWSTRGGVLNLCADSQALAGGGTVTTPRGGTGSFRVPSAPPMNSSERYTCAGSRLDTERDIPRSAPMPFHYTRTGG
jgi:hypothetical protein